MPTTIGDVDSRGGLNPNESQYFFKSTGLEEGAFSVRAFEGSEAISRPYEFRLDLRSDDPDIAASDVIGKKATLLLRDREIHGIVSEFSYVGLTRDEHIYHAVLRPRIWTRSLRRDSEILLGVDARDVIRAALADLEPKFDISESLPVKEYVVQYNETDLDFLSRTAEHWGIAYRLNHKPGGSDEVEFFTDSTASPPVADASLRFDAEQSLRGDHAAANSLVEKESLVPGRVLVKDYNYRDPETALLSETEVRSDDFDSLHYEYGTHHGAQDEGDYLAKVRSQEIECRRRVFSGESNWHQLEAGYIFELENHPRSAFNGKYLITSVQHRGSHTFGGHAEEAGASGPTYQNTFTCIPAAIPFRPERLTPIPRIPGVMTAKVESGGGDYAHIDSDGRYNARMHFDLGDRGHAEASAPIRMNQPYSGPGYGLHFPNHANTEIVWACINGDPNRPIAIGTAPNPSNASPVSSSNKSQNVIKTWGGHFLIFDDEKGAELIAMFSTKDHTVQITNNEEIEIGNDRTIHVKRSHDETIDQHMSLTVGVNSTEDVGSSKTLSVGSSYSVTVGATMNLSVGAASTESVGGAKSLSVGASHSETIAGSKSVTVNGSSDERVNDDKSVMVAKNLDEKIDGKHTVQVTKECKVEAKKIQIIAADEIMFKTGSAQIVMKKNGKIEIKGKDVTVKGSGKIDVKADGVLTLKGSQIKAN